MDGYDSSQFRLPRPSLCSDAPTGSGTADPVALGGNKNLIFSFSVQNVDIFHKRANTGCVYDAHIGILKARAGEPKCKHCLPGWR